ncbi:hypothetical protein ACF0HT_13590 (plasmid) [Staphylococcus xylosus]|uniref:hypothetical protein n=1 Tax=Staphylococcus xylosus TaxID=1288 RepID=UPI003749F067
MIEILLKDICFMLDKEYKEDLKLIKYRSSEAVRGYKSVNICKEETPHEQMTIDDILLSS